MLESLTVAMFCMGILFMMFGYSIADDAHIAFQSKYRSSELVPHYVDKIVDKISDTIYICVLMMITGLTMIAISLVLNQQLMEIFGLSSLLFLFITITIEQFSLKWSTEWTKKQALKN